MKIKQHFIDAKNKWYVQHFPLIIMVILFTSTYLSVNPIELPTAVMAYEKETTNEISYDALLEKYTQEEEVKLHKQAQMNAVRRIFDESGVVADTLNPYLTGE